MVNNLAIGPLYPLEEVRKAADEERGKQHIIVYGPLVRFADELAEKRFRRAVSVTINAKSNKKSNDLPDDMDE